LERAELLKRRKEIYEAKYPESKAGVSQALGMHRALGHNVAEKISATSFTKDTAQKIGVTDRTIRYEIQIAKNIDNVGEKISSTSFTEDTAQKMNVDKRTVQYEIQIAKNIDNDVKFGLKRGGFCQKRENIPLWSPEFSRLLKDILTKLT
jgi:hypothetical protein